MASIGRITASAVTIPNEVTVAAAAFNIDFSLLKLEAPKEYTGLRQVLSPKRLKNAEGGQAHITARQLGALFEAKVPPIPHLISAYGTRVSEICSEIDQEPQSYVGAGIFAGHSGPDGLNIWAGATSGTGGLAAHLLACILARIWKPHEAISLWVEIVERRRNEIMEAFGAASTMEAAALMAAQQIISRQQLAAWDASARSWLHTADSVKRTQHIQLNLIINNLNLAVNTTHDPYKSVVDTWISAMQGMEFLVQGVSQRLTSAAVLLGMSSLHLYPDMEVLLKEPTSIYQRDDLLQGSVVTISSECSTSSQKGVSWSLPLSRMRFYSPPVTTERQLAISTNRVTMSDFCIAVLGAVIASWSLEKYGKEEVCKLIIYLEQKISDKCPSWLQMLSRASSKYIQAQGVEREYCSKLLMRGIRRGRGFLFGDDLPLPFCFGLGDPRAVLELARYITGEEERMESQIRILREISASLNLDPEDTIIRYKRRKRPQLSKHKRPGLSTMPDEDDEWEFEYASAMPLPGQTRKRRRDGGVRSSANHCRWVVLASDSKGRPPNVCHGRLCGCIVQSTGVSLCDCAERLLPCNEYCHRDSFQCKSFVPWFPTVCCGKCSYENSCANCALRLEVPKTDHEVEAVRQPVDEIVRSASALGNMNGWTGVPGWNMPLDLQGNEPNWATIMNWDDWDDDDPEAEDQSQQRDLRHALSSRACKCSHDLRCAGWYNSTRRAQVEKNGETCHFIIPDDFWESGSFERFELTRGDSEGVESFECILGIPSEAGIFRKVNDKNAQAPSEHEIHPSTITHLLDDFVHADNVQSFLSSQLAGSTRELTAVSFAESIYEELPGASVSMEAFSVSLRDVRWPRWISETTKTESNNGLHFADPHKQDDLLTRGEKTQLAVSFACIGMFDSGEFDIDPRFVRGTFALSTGDSIFMVSSLAEDPSETQERTKIKRILGNLGRPEMAFLVPPAKPMLRGSDLASWHLVNHAPFDGDFKNSFGSTSLHLTLTDFEMPVDVGVRGLRDTQVVILESVVSLNDGGKYLGDLDIMRCLGDDLLRVKCSCKPHMPADASRDDLTAMDEKMILEGLRNIATIDCWDEFFDFPISQGLIRATGNWQARMAATAASIQKGKRTLVLPRDSCLRCLRDAKMLGGFDVIIG